MINQRTSGPWVDKFQYNSINDEKHNVCIAKVTPIDEVYFNAKLIAAAPDMLEALQAAIALSDKSLEKDRAACKENYLMRTPECQAVYNQVQAAINKATL